MASDKLCEPTPLAIRRVTYDKILLFGDSLTELSSDVLTLSFALTPALQHYYFRKLAVVARGYGGYNSEHLRHVLLPTILAETAAGEKIKLLVIEIGTNDASTNQMQSVAVERYGQNLEWMVEKAKTAGVERIILIGPGVVDQRMLSKPTYNCTMRNLQYSKATRAVAEKNGIPFIDMWQAMLQSIGWREGQPVPGEENTQGVSLKALLTDGVHLTGNGYRIWYDELLKVVSIHFPDLRTEELPTVLPHIYDVDRSNLPDTLWQEIHVQR